MGAKKKLLHLNFDRQTLRVWMLTHCLHWSYWPSCYFQQHMDIYRCSSFIAIFLDIFHSALTIIPTFFATKMQFNVFSTSHPLLSSLSLSLDGLFLVESNLTLLATWLNKARTHSFCTNVRFTGENYFWNGQQIVPKRPYESCLCDIVS